MRFSGLALIILTFGHMFIMLAWRTACTASTPRTSPSGGDSAVLADLGSDHAGGLPSCTVVTVCAPSSPTTPGTRPLGSMSCWPCRCCSCWFSARTPFSPSTSPASTDPARRTKETKTYAGTPLRRAHRRRRRNRDACGHRSRSPGAHGSAHQAHPTCSHTGAAQGGMCAALANVEEDNWGGTPSTPSRAATTSSTRTPPRSWPGGHRRGARPGKMGLPFNPHPRGPHRSAPLRRTHPRPRQAPVRRACYAADRTDHMILQTLYQNCVKHDVEFFNEVLRPRPVPVGERGRRTDRDRHRRLRAGHR